MNGYLKNTLRFLSGEKDLEKLVSKTKVLRPNLGVENISFNSVPNNSPSAKERFEQYKQHAINIDFQSDLDKYNEKGKFKHYVFPKQVKKLFRQIKYSFK